MIRSITKESLYEFVREFWDTIIPEKPVWNWHIKYICDELQYVAERVFLGLPKEYDLIINISPGSTKSTICSVMYQPWIWTRMASARIIGGSYAKELSMDLSRRGRDIVKSEKYKRCFPEIVLRRDQDVKSHFANTEGGSRYACGTGGAVTGFHAHFIIVDDPLNPNEALSEVELKNANTWMSETLSQRKVDKGITPTILIMQRLHQNDPTANMIERAKLAQKNEGGELKLKHICLPAVVTKNVKPRKLVTYYENGLMDPIRLPKSVLNENMATLGEYGYAGQFLQNPVPLGGGMFKAGRIIVDESPKKWKMIVRFWDKAGTAEGGAYTAGVKIGLDTGKRYWILDVQRGQWGSDVRERIIKQIAQIDGRDVIVGVEQEPGSGGKESAENTVRNLAGWIVRVDRPTGSKELRADPFSVQVNNRNVYMVKAEWNLAYLGEMEFFPMSTYKDQIDASSGAFNILTKGRIAVGGLGR